MGQALGCVQVHESNVAVMEKWGEYKDALKPGYHCVPWCWGYNVVGRLKLSLQPLDIRCETITQDNVSVTVFASVQYRYQFGSELKEKGKEKEQEKQKEKEREKAKNAFYNLTNAEAQIRSCIVNVIGERVPQWNLDDALKGKNEIAAAVENKLKQDLSPHGYEIRTLIIDIEPEVDVKEKMKEEHAASLKEIKTTAEIKRQIELAKGDAEAKRLLGCGIAGQRKAIVDGLRDSVRAFTEQVQGTTGKDVMDMELATQYFDTMKEIGTSSKASHVFLLHGPDAVKDIAAHIRSEIIQGKQVEERRLSIH